MVSTQEKQDRRSAKLNPIALNVIRGKRLNEFIYINNAFPQMTLTL